MYLGDAVAWWLACSTNDREVGVRVSLAAGGRVATVGQLLFEPWAWAYSTLHPFMVRKWVQATSSLFVAQRQTKDG